MNRLAVTYCGATNVYLRRDSMGLHVEAKVVRAPSALGGGAEIVALRLAYCDVDLHMAGHPITSASPGWVCPFSGRRGSCAHPSNDRLPLAAWRSVGRGGGIVLDNPFLFFLEGHRGNFQRLARRFAGRMAPPLPSISEGGVRGGLKTAGAAKDRRACLREAGCAAGAGGDAAPGACRGPAGEAPGA